jgi:hypothetical protein
LFVNELMKLGLLTLETMFVLGSIGTTVVLVCVGFEVLHTVLEPGEDEQPSAGDAAVRQADQRSEANP